MVFVNPEESIEILHGFLKYAFDEMSSENWETRRNELFQRQNIYSTQDVMVHYTFQEMTELYYGGDTDAGLIPIFVGEITTHVGWRWLEAWVYEHYPALDTRGDGILCWDMWDAMDEILDKSKPDLVIELREILDLDMFLK
jgi:hypothetical protein